MSHPAPVGYALYHAHVYYDPATREEAAHLREGIDTAFRVQLGQWHDTPVGPHPQGMYQVVFTGEQFPRVVPWLMEHHGSLSILIHPDTGDDLGDHADRALWLGRQLELRLELFREG